VPQNDLIIVDPNSCGVVTSPYPPREGFKPPTEKQIVLDTEREPEPTEGDTKKAPDSG
jgi:hypothetical protein